MRGSRLPGQAEFASFWPRGTSEFGQLLALCKGSSKTRSFGGLVVSEYRIAAVKRARTEALCWLS